jgi:hypothetical protein
MHIPETRLCHLARQIHALGERPLFEVFRELNSGSPLGETLERYARLEPLAAFIASQGGEGLEIALGRGRDGRLVGELPGFPTAGHELAMTAVAAAQGEVAAAAETWRLLSRTWAQNPRTDAAKVLHFVKPGSIPENLSYHELSGPERAIVDAHFAANT